VAGLVIIHLVELAAEGASDDALDGVVTHLLFAAWRWWIYQSNSTHCVDRIL